MGGAAAAPGGRPPEPAEPADPVPTATGVAASSCSAWASRAGESLMAFLTPAVTVGLPAKRSRPLTSTSAAKMTTSAAAISSGGIGVAPAAPWVSTVMV